MGPIKIERIISVSSEDPVYPAENLLKQEYNHKKWKCKLQGEKQAVVVLQLEQSSKIKSIDVGNEFSAFMEILVAKSSSPDDYKVLLSSSSLMSLQEAKYGTNGNGVRFFKKENLCESILNEKWDRIKIICTQPYNKTVQFGLSFIIFHSPSDQTDESSQSSNLGRFKLKDESDDPISIGSIFARRKELTQPEFKGAAAIRASSSDPQSIMKRPQIGGSDVGSSEGTKDAATSKETKRNRKNADKHEETKKNKNNAVVNGKIPKRNATDPVHKDSSKKIKLKPPDKKVRKMKPFNKLFEDVIFVISGFQNPLRSDIRSKAVSMGAKYKPDWDSSCTHLVCAFANTPKFTQVKGIGKIVKKEWVEECYLKRIRFPWRRYALDKQDLSGCISEEEIFEETEQATTTTRVPAKPVDNRRRLNSPSSEDTDDEIERVMVQYQNQPSTSQNIVSSVSTSEIKKMTINETNKVDIYDMDTEDEMIDPSDESLSPISDLFVNMAFYISDNLSADQKKKLTRYIVAHKGSVVDHLKEEVEYIITEDSKDVKWRIEFPGLTFVKPEWIWKAHDENKLIPMAAYEISA